LKYFKHHCRAHIGQRDACRKLHSVDAAIVGNFSHDMPTRFLGQCR
jgi:hypothetical protein